MTIKKHIILTTLFILGSLSVFGNIFHNESLNYQIVYHWGVIWKHAANASLEINHNNDTYEAKLYAHTLSWVDKIYKVRDTLNSTIDKKHFIPIKYIKATHEKNHIGRDIVEFNHENGYTIGNCIRIRPNKEDFKTTLKTKGNAYDMLSVFYMLRTLDINKLKQKGIFQTTIFSGKRQEILEIRYIGIENIKLRDKSKHKAYHLTFSFTQEGKEKSSDDIDTWLSMDDTHIPLMLKGSLPIGEVCVYYTK